MADIPTADWSWINEVAEHFERAWKKGPRPRIEDFLAKEPELRRPPLLSELLRVERELRAQAGETPTAEEYRRRFPEHDVVVASVFTSVPLSSEQPSKSSRGGATTAATSGRVSTLPPELANHPDYEIIRELGHGGMGVVFLAHNRIIARDEVLKVIGLDVIEGHTSVVSAISVSPDGSRLFSSQWGRQELWIWDVETRKLVHSLNWRSGMPTRDSFTPDGRHFVCGRDRAVRLYGVTDPRGSHPAAAPAAGGRAGSRKKR